MTVVTGSVNRAMLVRLCVVLHPTFANFRFCLEFPRQHFARVIKRRAPRCDARTIPEYMLEIEPVVVEGVRTTFRPRWPMDVTGSLPA